MLADMNEKQLMIPDEVVVNKIYIIRSQRVMLDRDLSELYGVATKVLKQTVRRNIKRFPTDCLKWLSKSLQFGGHKLWPPKKIWRGSLSTLERARQTVLAL